MMTETFSKSVRRSLAVFMLCGPMSLSLCSGCQQSENDEPPLTTPAPLGEQSRLFQQRQIDKARAEAATHTVPAEDANSNSQTGGTAALGDSGADVPSGGYGSGAAAFGK